MTKKTKKLKLAKAKPKNKEKNDTEAKAKAKTEAEAKESADKKAADDKKKVDSTPEVQTPEKGKKNYACFLSGKYWRFYNDKKLAEDFVTGRGKSKIVVLEDSKIKEYEAKKAEMIAANEAHKDSMSAQPGGMPETWQRTFRGVPIL